MSSGHEEVDAFMNGSISDCLDQTCIRSTVSSTFKVGGEGAHKHPPLPEGLLTAGGRRVSLLQTGWSYSNEWP